MYVYQLSDGSRELQIVTGRSIRPLEDLPKLNRIWETITGSEYDTDLMEVQRVSSPRVESKEPVVAVNMDTSGPDWIYLTNPC